MIDLHAVGKTILKYREEKGWSQDDLADRLFVSRQAVSAWESAKSAPSIDNVLELCQLFGLSPEELLCLGKKPVFNPENVWEGHDRNFVVSSVINGILTVDLTSFLYDCTGKEREQVLFAIHQGKLKADLPKLLPLLTDDEKQRWFMKGDN